MPLSQTILVLGARGFGPRSWLAGTRLGAGGLRFSMLGTRLRSWGPAEWLARGSGAGGPRWVARLWSWGPAEFGAGGLRSLDGWHAAQELGCMAFLSSLRPTKVPACTVFFRSVAP